MKRYKYLFLTLIIALFTNNINADNFATLNRKLSTEIENSINVVTNPSEFYSSTLNQIIEIEKPTEYQKTQIYNMFNYICSIVQNSNLKTKKDLISLINSLIPDNSSNFNYDTTLFKHAFPESEGKQPLGSFDCDARSLMAISVLEALKKNKNIYVVDMNGHAILTDIKTNEYFDLTLKDINIIPEESKLLTSNILFSQDDIKSLLLSNLETDMIMKYQGNIITRKQPNEEKMQEAEQLLQEAITLNPKNIVAINNIKSTKTSDKEKVTCDVQILAILVANYTDNYQAKTPNQFILNKENNYSITDTKDSNDFSKAFENNPIVSNFTLNTVLRKFYYAGMYKEFLRFGNEIAKLNKLNSIPGIYMFYYQMAYANAMMKNYDSYEIYKNKFDDVVKYNNESKAELEYIDYAIEIIKGNISAKDMSEDQYFPLYTEIVHNIWSNVTSDARQILESWDGYENFRNEAIRLDARKVKNIELAIRLINVDIFTDEDFGTLRSLRDQDNKLLRQINDNKDKDSVKDFKKRIEIALLSDNDSQALLNILNKNKIGTKDSQTIQRILDQIRILFEDIDDREYYHLNRMAQFPAFQDEIRKIAKEKGLL